jgi:PAS domain S-box-containing protein
VILKFSWCNPQKLEELMMPQPYPWIFRDSPTLLALLDEQLVCREMSKAWRDHIGLVATSEVSISLPELFSPKQTPTWLDQIENLLHTGQRVRERPVSLRSGNNTTHGLLSAWRFRDEGRRLWIIVSVICTERLNKTLEQLASLQSKHQAILDAAGEGIYGLDSQGRTTFGNAAATEILGWKPGHIMGQSAHDVHHHSFPDGSPYPREQCPIYAALKDGEVHCVDNEVFWHSDGSAVPVEYTSTPIRQNGQLNGAVVMFRDISERKKFAQQREQDYKEIKHLKEQLELERDYPL